MYKRQVGFSARRASSSQTINHSTTTDVVFNTEIKDTNNAYDHSTGIFTAPVTGFYVIGSTWNWADAQGNMDVQTMHIMLDSSQYAVSRVDNASNGTLFTKISGSWCSILGTINSGTEIKMRVYIETTNASAAEILHTDYLTTFWGWNLA